MRSDLDVLSNDEAAVHPPAAITIPEMTTAGITRCLGTIFTEPDGMGPEGYEAGDAESASHAGREQLSVYERWARDGTIEVARYGRFDEHSHGTDDVLTLGILIENADPIREPDELVWWHDHGVVAIGLTWANDSRYACGNATTDDIGITDLGRHLVSAIDTLHITHDVSHLSPRAVADVLEHATGQVIASHSNCAELLKSPGETLPPRHLSDETIQSICDRQGVIGINLFSPFLVPPGAHRRATIDDVIAHIEHVCAIGGSTRHVGLGSDMDGGFSAERLPIGLERPQALNKVLEALSERGWSETDRDRFAWGNWSRIFAGMSARHAET